MTQQPGAEIVRQHRHLWLDLETTGLDPHVDRILEWAIALCEDDGPEECPAHATDQPDHGMPIVQSFSGVISYGADRVQEMRAHADPYVQRMHEANGLWEACSAPPTAEGTSTLEEADAFLRQFCQDMTGQEKPTGMVLAGASVHFDLGFVRVHFPRFAQCLSHRVFDVSTLTAAERAWGEESLIPAGGGGSLGSQIGTGEHRALPDVLGTIERAALLRARRWRIGS